MKQLIRTFGMALAFFSIPALAAPKTVILSVSGMTCAVCPITVKKALEKVKGVEKVATSFEKKEAVVTFDDSKTTINDLTQATKNAGFPSTVKR